MACKIEETVDKEINDIAYTIKIAPNISDKVRISIIGFLKSWYLKGGIFGFYQLKLKDKLKLYLLTKEFGQLAYFLTRSL